MANLRTNNLCGQGGRNAYNGSVFFDGNYSFLSLDSGAVPSFGTDSFTIEFWINQGVNTSDYTILISLYASTNAKRFEVAFHSGTIQVYTDTGAWRDTGYAPVSGVFEHIAFQRDSSGNTLKMYANGEEKWSVSNTRDYDEPWSTKIGSYNLSSTGHFQGYISNLRICAGHLIYFSNYFTPPTSPLTAHFTNSSNRTVLLCCQNSDNPLEDNSASIPGESIPQTITGYGRHADTSVELVTNGGPTTNVTGWTANRGTVEYENGQIKQTRSGGTGFGSYATITNAVIGQRYRLSAQVRSVSSRCDLYVTTAIESGSLLGLSGTAGETVDLTGVFTATATTLYVFTAVDNDGDVGYYNRVSVKAADYGDAPKVLPPFGTDNGVTFDGAISMNSSSYMCFPTGRTEERGRGRGVIMGGVTHTPTPNSYMSQIDFLTIPTMGNSQLFGDLSFGSRDGAGAVSSTIRAIYAGGMGPASEVATNSMSFITIPTQGNGTDYGDLTAVRRQAEGCSNGVRGLFMGGENDTPSSSTHKDVIDFCTIATTGNASDFGDLTEARDGGGVCSSPIRGVCGGGVHSGNSDVIDFVTIATTGNATDFGNLTFARVGATGCASATRGLFMGGRVAPNNKSEIDYITIASTGNALDFGDLQQQRIQASATASQTRGVHIGGNPGSSPNNFTNMQFVTIASLGNASDFGDTFAARSRRSASDCHGGLS